MTELRFSTYDAQGLDERALAYADAHIKSYIERGLLSGASLLVARHGAIAHFKPQGLMDHARGRPVTQDTIFRIYSMTKPITSVAFMMLFEQGRIQLDDPVAKFIPAFADLRVYKAGTLGGFLTTAPNRPMTVRDLLTHQSGLTYGFQSRSNVDAAYRALAMEKLDTPLAAWVKKLASLPLEFSPGAAWNYSVSTDVAGRLIEILADEPLDSVLRSRIFEPLGMTDTDFFVPPEKKDRFAACYQLGPQGRLELQDDPQTSDYLKMPVLLAGGGGLVSTALDYYRFAQMLASGGSSGGRRFLGRKTLALMSANHLPDGADLAARAVGLFSEGAMAGMGFGLGFSVMLDPAKAQVPGTPGEFAWGGAASTYFWVDPVEELVVVFMAQLLPSSALNIRRELRSILYGALV